jgi:8-oxo-dGTP pyrophosphatase MutT (NUDIX family)
MEKSIKKKVVVYVTQNNNILVFRHVEYSYEEIGLQVPSGTVKEGEELETAALRELIEETGFSDFKIVSYLGIANYDQSPYRNEIHERHFYLAKPTKELPERWFSQEDHDGKQEPTKFECFWIPVTKGHIIQGGQSEFIWKINEVLES